MEFSWGEIKLTDLILKPAYYKITTCSEIDNLTEAIAAVGLLQPILVYPENGRYVILAGHRRVAAVAAMGCDSVVCRIIPSSATPLQRAMIAIADNTSQRQLNLVEQSRALVLLKNATDNEKTLPDLGRNVGLALSHDLIAKLDKIYEMIPAIQDGLISGEISLPVALRLGQLDPGTAVVLVELFTKMGIGLNRQRQLLTWIEEIALRDKIGILDVLIMTNVIPISQDMEGRDKKNWVNSIMRSLKFKRYPALVKAENCFKDTLKRLNLPAGMRIEPPAYFEGNSYRVSFIAKNKQDFSKYGRNLERMSKMRELEQIFQ